MTIPAQCKLLATFLFVLAVVATPREAFWAFAVYAALVVGTAAVARVPPGWLARRLTIELPFVAFAFFLPVLSPDGEWWAGAWNILVKGTLGVAASSVLVATTAVPDILHGLERLRLPRALTSIASFMVRYVDVIVDDMRRMRVARESRGYDPRWLWQARAVASSAGTLFVRSYERGERVYLAMLARGFDGTFPVLDDRRGTPAEWAAALAVPAVAIVVAATALVVQ